MIRGAMTKQKQRPKKPKTAELVVQRKNISDLQPHENNPRFHPDPGSPDWEALKRSLKDDYFDPLVWNRRNGKLVSGHLRRKVLIELGYKAADVVVVDYDEATHVARMIAANRLAGDDDKAAMAALLRGMDGERLLTGMAEDDIAVLLKSMEPPAGFTVVDENIPIAHVCPKCGYQWSGKPS